MEYYLSPSILSADFTRLGEDVKKAADAGAQWIHIDVMDGMFVPNISLGMPIIKCLRSVTDKVFDVHLMVEEPGRYVEEFVKCGADIITVHAEACTHLDRVIQQIKQLGCKAGVVLNPGTPLTVLDYVLDELDMVLLMSVNPGYGGQSYIPYTDQKIKDLREMIDARGLDTIIQIDGGVTADNVGRLMYLGANAFVAGSAVFNGDIEGNVKKMLKAMED